MNPGEFIDGIFRKLRILMLPESIAQMRRSDGFASDLFVTERFE